MPLTEHARSASASSDHAALATASPPCAPYVPRPAPPAVQRAQALAVFSLVALILLSLAWELWLAPLRPGGSWLALKALPLCLPLAGFLKHRMYTYRWMSLMVWLYFTEGVVRAWSDRSPSNWLALLEVALCLLLFAACILLIRVRLRGAPVAQANEPGA